MAKGRKGKFLFAGTALAAALWAAVCLTNGSGSARAAEEKLSAPGSYAVSAAPLYFLRSTENVPVYAEPFSEAEIQALAPQGTLFPVLGETDSGWLQVVYLGERRYLSGQNTEPYTGGEEQTQLPMLEKREEYRAAFLGDSITYGDKLEDPSWSYAALLAERMCAAGYYNYGWNGSCMGGDHPDRFLDRYSEMEEDADLIFVLGGTNDYGFATPLGAETDMEGDTFYGCLNLLMCGLKQKYSIFMTPLRRTGGERKNEEGLTLEDYSDAILDRGEFYDIPVADLYRAQELDFEENDAYLADGLHPNADGQRKIADYLYRILFPAHVSRRAAPVCKMQRLLYFDRPETSPR